MDSVVHVTAPAVPSYHARRGRLTPAARRALDELGPRYAPALPLPPGSWVVEIGSGMGDAAVAMAQADPDTGIVAVEVHTRGVARLLQDVHRLELPNVRVVHGDAVELLTAVAPHSLTGIRAWFLDPWPKARHHKRRLVQPPFVHLAASRLRAGGLLHLATDWQDYADQMLAVLHGEPLLRNQFDGPAPRPEWRPLTPYEQAGIDQGHVVTDLLFERVAPD